MKTLATLKLSMRKILLTKLNKKVKLIKFIKN